MASYAVILSVIFSLFVLSHARTLSNPDVSVTETTPLSIFSESDDKTTQLSFSTDKSDENNELSDTIAAVGIARPLVTPFDGRFRPINRHFPHPNGRGPFPHRCGHHHRHHHHGEHRVEVPYGKDAIGADDMRQIPYGDDMIGADGRPVRQRGFGFHGERHGHMEEEEEEGGVGRWFREILNRF
ncbi:hypothetical protein AAC387_Pa01g2658 [Persea americana]